MLEKLRKKLPKKWQGSKFWERQSKTAQQKLAFDQQVVWQQTQKKKIPSLRQFKYISSFFSVKEQFAIIVSILAMFGAASLTVFFLYAQFVQPVPTTGGVYREALIGRPVYVNPILATTNDVDLDLAKLVYAGLMRFDQDLEAVPDLAESLEINEEQTLYTLTLKENITWHDGEPVTAQDVLFTYKSIQDPLVNSPLQLSMQNVQVSIIDDRTIQFSLDEAFTPFISLLTIGILPQHLWGNIPPGNVRLAENNIKPIGAGPWQFDRLEKDKQGNIRTYTLTPFENYHEKAPYLEQLTFKFYPNDLEGAIEALNTNKVDGISFVPRQSIDQINNAQTYQTFALELPQYTSLFFNEDKNEEIENLQVRQALAYAIDRDRLIAETLSGNGEKINGPLIPGADGYNPDFPGFPFNPIEAQALLEEAGWEPIDEATYIELETQRIIEEREDAAAAAIEEAEAETEDEASTEEVDIPVDDSPIEINTNNQVLFRKNADDEFLTIRLTTIDQPETRRAAELIRDAWTAIGVQVQLEFVSRGSLQDVILPAADYEVLLWGHILNVYPDYYTFWHSSQIEFPGLNFSQFADADADRLLEEVRQTIDPTKRAELHTLFQEIVDTQLPAIFLYTPRYTYILPQSIKGFEVERIAIPADRFNNVTEWYIKTKKQLKRNE